MLQDKQWILKNYDSKAVSNLKSALNINQSLCSLLNQRGITTYDEAFKFFRPSLKDLHDPFQMQDMDKAIDRIINAFKHNENIMVYGDYDVDGTTAVAIVFHFLQKNRPYTYTGKISYYIPHRYKEGYGISKLGIQSAKKNDVKLIIALDCGIKSMELVNYANKINIDFIICDHHLPDEKIPNAIAVLNPKRKDDNYPYKELSGCGIGFKLITALAQKLNISSESYLIYLDMVATSIAADIVPINGENRVLAYFGIKKLNENPFLPLKTLMELIKIDTKLHISDIVFTIAPRINAAGRMDDANKTIDFFVEENPVISQEKAEFLQIDNVNRKEKDKDTTDDALDILSKEDPEAQLMTTVIYNPNWHKGVVGIVASRLIDHFYRPTIVLTNSDGFITGSARSVKGFNIHDAIAQCSELLENYGGHAFAAGLTLKPENLPAFKEKFESIVRHSIAPQSMTPSIEIDVEIPIYKIQESFFNTIKQFEPFGPTNLRPVFTTRKVRNYLDKSKVVKEQHIRFVVCKRENGRINKIAGIGFNLAEKFHYLKNGEVDIVYTIDENVWHDTKNIQIKVIDLKPSYN